MEQQRLPHRGSPVPYPPPRVTNCNRSGQAALFMTITALAQAGSNIIVASQVTDASAQLFRYRLPAMGITIRFVESGDMELVKQAIDENTKGVFVESIPSTELLVSDLETIAAVAHEAGVPLVVYSLH